ncbi:MAG: hypothetical protein JNK25_14880 [Phycisphaerae bacterium]|nr:hypothetical protein [Phycisphaerae bacterium]
MSTFLRRNVGRVSMAVSAMIGVSGMASAQTAGAPARTTAPAAAAPSMRLSGMPQRDTLIRMQRPITIDFTDVTLEAAMKFIAEVTGADMEVMWSDDQNSIGLDKEKIINLKIQKRTALDALERLLEKATTESNGPGGNTWQISEAGTLQVGPKERLNRFKRIEIYSVRDLLLEIPNYANAPDFDLQSVLQNSGQGGGSSQSPFREQGDQDQVTTRPMQERVDELIRLLTELVEPEQWVENGGDGASMRYYQSSLIVNGPDYIHRQLAGYPYWSQRATRYTMSKGRRYVTLGVDTAWSGLNGIQNVPVTPPK